MSAERDPRVDDLREQLRALGYLDARVDRFVLGGAVSTTRPLAFALKASVRIGILAGLLLGPAAAIGLRSRVTGLITSASDALVVAVYLTVFFGLAVTLLSALAVWLGTLALRGLAASPETSRRARRVAALAGGAVGLAGLAYLTLWWRTATAFGTASPWWALLALAVAAATSVLLGHAVAVTVLALLARRGLAAALSPGSPLSSPKVTFPLGGSALVGAIALLFASAPASTHTPAPALTVVPTGVRAIVLGVDGVDVATLDRLRAAGRLPTFDRLLRQAVATLPSDPDRDPARVWTTMATGQPPERHGVRALESRQVAGLGGRLQTESAGWAALAAATDVLRLTRPAIASADERLIPAFWEVAARAGLRTAVIHWWATWPAPDDAGIVLSDRAILRLEHPGPPDREIAPPALYDALRKTWTDRRGRAIASAATLGPVEVEGGASVARAAELDATILDLAADPGLGATDLLAIYLPGLDIAQHALLGSANAAGLAPSGAAERVAAIERDYVLLDQAIERLLQASATGQRVVCLVTQPGRIGTPSLGLFAVSGAGTREAKATGQVTSVAPTILAALGIPIARDLASAPLLDVFAPSLLAAHPVREVTTYGVRQLTGRPGAGQPLDKEMIERMRSLGYVR